MDGMMIGDESGGEGEGIYDRKHGSSALMGSLWAPGAVL